MVHYILVAELITSAYVFDLPKGCTYSNAKDFIAQDKCSQLDYSLRPLLVTVKLA